LRLAVSIRIGLDKNPAIIQACQQDWLVDDFDRCTLCGHAEEFGGLIGVHPDASVAAKMIDAPRRNGSMDANPAAVQTNPIFSKRIIGTRQNFGSDPSALFRHLALDRFRTVQTGSTCISAAV